MMAESDESGTTHVICEHCGYEWEYSGEMWKATCPRCNKKTITPHSPDYDEE